MGRQHRLAMQLRKALPEGEGMSEILYTLVRHDGGWAYEANGTFSEPFATRDAARKAALAAAREQSAPGERVSITYEDEQGRWHREVDGTADRPHASVEP